MCAYNIWCHKNGLYRRTSPRPSHVLAHHPNRPLPLVLRAMHEMENGCLPRLLPKKREQRGQARTREGTGQPRGPPKRFPRGRPETGQHLTKRHEATGGAVHLLACTVASMGDTHMDDFFLLCVSPFGAGMPNPGERLGFNLVCKKCSPQNYKRGGGVWVGQKSGGWVLGGSAQEIQKT